MIFVGVSCPLCILITKWNKNVLLTSIIAQTGRGDHQPPQLSSDLSNWEPETLPTHQHQHHYQHQPVSTNPAEALLMAGYISVNWRQNHTIYSDDPLQIFLHIIPQFNI